MKKKSNTTLLIFVCLFYSLFCFSQNRKNGSGLNFRAFAGAGVGGNQFRTGFSGGVSFLMNYKVHNLILFGHYDYKQDNIEAYGEKQLAMKGLSGGLLYGIGYERNDFAIAGGAGAGYLKSDWYSYRVFESSTTAQKALSIKHSSAKSISFCAGVLSNFKAGGIPLSAQFYLNYSKACITHSLLLGITFGGK